MIMYDYVWLCIYIDRYIHLYKLNYWAFFGNPWTHRILCSQKHWEDGAPWDPGFGKNQLQTWQLEIPKWSFLFSENHHWGSLGDVPAIHDYQRVSWRNKDWWLGNSMRISSWNGEPWVVGHRSIACDFVRWSHGKWWKSVCTYAYFCNSSLTMVDGPKCLIVLKCAEAKVVDLSKPHIATPTPRWCHSGLKTSSAQVRDRAVLCLALLRLKVTQGWGKN